MKTLLKWWVFTPILLWLIGLLVIARIGMLHEAVALVPCSTPSDCIPPCCGSCDYQECSGTGVQTLTIKEFPFTISPPAEACAGETTTYKTFPFTHEGTTYKTIPAEVTDSYSTCQTITVSGPCPCPPP